MKTCPKCKSNLSDTAKFCVKCGFNIKKFEEENASKEYFCAECGTKFSGGSFCPECGYNISADISLDNIADTDTVSVATVNTDSIVPSLDLGAMSSMAQEQLYEKEGFAVENGILTGYTGKKRIVTIPGTIEEIFDGAFEGNDLITFVEIEEGVRIIGKRAFANCSSLVKINIPASVKKIYDDTFDGVNLETLILPKSDMDMIKPRLSSVARKHLNAEELESYVSPKDDKFTVDIKAIEEIPTVKKMKALHNGLESGSLFFGSYYQSDNKTKEPIEWLVLEKADKKALLISKYVLDGKQFDTGIIYQWGSCGLRRWMNTEFVQSAFGDDEQRLIMSKEDKVFCLDEGEVNRYFPTSEKKKCVPTAYALNKGVECQGKFCPWWTRTGYLKKESASYYYVKFITESGTFEKDDIDVRRERYGVRPAMWIDLDL